ncbi:MAG TPA: cytochrome c3 family protein [Anaeromyxobacteraceae bacterium]|jgi:predicted CXXCH cytochrome family protein|nr:cytochrome c3 family protein [Anaeromyxobacteraceae bacterium]
MARGWLWVVVAWALGLALVGWQASSPYGSAQRQRRLEESCDLFRLPRAVTPSRSCLTCHDGTLAHAALPGPRSAGELANHPIDVDYEGARRAGSRLRPSAQLPREMPLVGGKVECVTCHDPRSHEPMKTALPMNRSRLCFACHDL